jgi:hypothetical protein
MYNRVTGRLLNLAVHSRRMRLEIKKGKHMQPRVLKEVDKIWRKAFTVTYTSVLREGGGFANDIFFILYDKKEILSTGRLRPISNIQFMKKKYSLLGIADIVSVIRGKGYGKRIMKAIKKYLNSKNEIGIGFCRRNNSPFYRKCGFNIGENLITRFIFTNKKGKLIKNEWDDDIIYSYMGKGLVNKMRENPKEKILIPRGAW